MRTAIEFGIILALAGGPLAAAPALKERPAPMATVRGEWVAEQTLLGGNDISRAVDRFRYTFEADGTWVYTSANGPGTSTRHEYTADPKASPTAIDLVADPAGPARRTLRGIFRVEGDTLTLCYSNDPKADRPTEFASPPGTDLFLITLRRVKAKD